MKAKAVPREFRKVVEGPHRNSMYLTALLRGDEDIFRVASVSVRSRQKLGARGWANHPPQAAVRVCR